MAARRLLSSAAAGVSVVVAVGTAAADDRPGAPVPPIERRDGPEPRRQRFRISEETTRLVEPLTAEGFIDFAAALNRQHGAGVTPENNAVVALWSVFGPESIPEESRAGFFARLGMPVPPPEGNYLLQPADAGEEKVVQAQLFLAIAEPWSRRDFPDLADWLGENQHFLRQLIDGSRRDRFFEPIDIRPVELFTGERINPGLMAVSSRSVLLARRTVRALLARAMLCLASGELDDAREALVAAHRWSRLLGQFPDTFAWDLSLALEQQVIEAETHFILDERLPREQLEQMRDALQQLPPRPDLGERCDRWERFVFVDMVCQASAGRPLTVLQVYNDFAWIENRQLQFVAFEDRPAFLERVTGRVVESLIASIVDWNAILREGNQWYDRAVAVIRLPRKQRRADIAGLRADWDKFRVMGFLDQYKIALAPWLDYFTAPRVWPNPPLRLPVGTLSSARREFHQLFLTLVLTSPHHWIVYEDRFEVRFRALTITLGLAAYRQRHGRFPDRLEALAPAAGELPPDPFSDEPFRYRLTEEGFLLYSVGPNGRDDGGKRVEDGPEADRPDDIVSAWPRPQPEAAP